MSRSAAGINAKCSERALAHAERLKADFPHEVMDRYLLMMLDRPVESHHVAELRRNTRSRIDSERQARKQSRVGFAPVVQGRSRLVG